MPTVQVAMITLHSSAPWLPVCLGSLVAFLLLTFSAVVAATLVQNAKLSERFVLGVSAWPGHGCGRQKGKNEGFSAVDVSENRIYPCIPARVTH